MPDLKVQPNEIDGWDVVRADEDVALTNHPTRESAEEAARMRSQEESLSEEGPGEVIVDPDHTHAIDETQRGVKTYFVAVIGLLIAIAILATIAALVGAETGFGS